MDSLPPNLTIQAVIYAMDAYLSSVWAAWRLLDVKIYEKFKPEDAKRGSYESTIEGITEARTYLQTAENANLTMISEIPQAIAQGNLSTQPYGVEIFIKKLVTQIRISEEGIIGPDGLINYEVFTQTIDNTKQFPEGQPSEPSNGMSLA